MDKRIVKTKEAIFVAFFDLLNESSFQQISVGDIIEKANIGRSTFYSHFTSKDDLLSAVCQHLFDHVFVTASYSDHRLVDGDDFEDSLADRIAHLFYHFKQNDDKVLTLFRLNDDYFRRSLHEQLALHLSPPVQEYFFSNSTIPPLLLQEHIISTFISCLNWWLRYASDKTAEDISQYFLDLL